MDPISLPDAISAFGAEIKAKLSNRAITGAPEDQVRAPLEKLFADIARILGLEGAVSLVGESTLAEIKTRPDYAVTVQKALVGFIEVKAPGKGADPRRFSDPHDKKQWEKLKSLPNLLYTDGQEFSVWRDGVLDGAIIRLDGDIQKVGAKLAAPPTLLPLITGFLQWSPIAPRSVRQLAEMTARLCRLLRDEVTEALENKNPALTALASEWRTLLFPQANDQEFADGYAQAVTFGLLVARARDIPLDGGIDKAALDLRKSNSLIASALRLLTDDAANLQALKTSLDTLTRVLHVVDWTTLTKGDADAWLYFYEDFLAVYDNALRKRTGSYYTPPEVVEAMVRLVDEALRDPALFNLPKGLASREVTIADPAVGTGTFLLGVIRRMAKTIEEDEGPGAVGPAIAAAADRLIGFEMQFGPFAVAQLRLLAEMQTLVGVPGAPAGNIPSPRLFITDTLGDPYAAQTQFSSMTAPIGESRRKANEIKRGEPITVVIGNPPYKEKAKGRGGWIEAGSPGRPAAMDLWRPPPEWGIGTHTHHLKNLYVFFWRWATWKVFGSGYSATTGEPDTDRAGIICFITVAGFLNGPGFQKMREDLRRDCSNIWVIDCSPEGHQPDVSTRVFQGVQQTICIVLANRAASKNREIPSRVYYLSLGKGKRNKKFLELSKISLGMQNWVQISSRWRSSFLPDPTGHWADFSNLNDIIEYSVSGITPHRTWIISPDTISLEQRWDILISESDFDRKNFLFHADHDRNIVTIPNSSSLPRFMVRDFTVQSETNGPIDPVRYSFRSFDRQWILPDSRLISRPRPELWNSYSPRQVFLTALDRSSPSGGPAFTITGLIPDLDHYKGSFGGRVFPLWRDAAATVGNVKHDVLAAWSAALGRVVTAPDVFAYIAALLAHPAFTARFKADLVRPGLRVPLTADQRLYDEAVALGREVVWLHCYGERFADPAEGRPAGAPRLPKTEAPTIPIGGAIPMTPDDFPNEISHDPASNRLHIGKGYIDNVPAAVWAYEVSGKQIIKQWFSYRKKDRTRPLIGDRRPPSPLDGIQPDHWLPDYTSDLIDLLHVLGRLVKLEPAQADLLDRVCAAPLLPLATIARDDADSAGDDEA